MRRQVDSFDLELRDVGPLLQLGVRSDGAGGPAAPWLLDWVAVTGPARLTAGAAAGGDAAAATAPGVGPGGGTGEGRAVVWFVARRWLDAVRGLEVTLGAQAAAPEGAGAGGGAAVYGVTVHTSDLR